MAGASEPSGHPGEERAGLGRPLGGGGLASMLLSPGRDVAVLPTEGCPSRAERKQLSNGHRRNVMPTRMSGSFLASTAVAVAMASICSFAAPAQDVLPRPEPSFKGV